MVPWMLANGNSPSTLSLFMYWGFEYLYFAVRVWGKCMTIRYMHQCNEKCPLVASKATGTYRRRRAIGPVYNPYG